MQNSSEFDRIAPILEELLTTVERAKINGLNPKDRLFYALKSKLNNKTDEEITEFIREVEYLSNNIEAVIEDAENSTKLYGWSAETWAYRRILDKLRELRDNDSDDIGYFEYFDKFLRDVSRSLTAITKDTPDIMLSGDIFKSADHKQINAEEGKETAGIDLGAQVKKSANVHYQKSMKIDANSLDAHTSDVTDLANRLSKNAALAGVGEMAISASVAIASNAIKNRSVMGGGELVKVLLKSGTDSAIRNALIGSLKIGAERNLLPIFGRMPSTVVITGVAVIAIQSTDVAKDYLRQEIDGLTAVSKFSRITTATVLALGLSGVGMEYGAAIAEQARLTQPVLNQILTGSAIITGGITGNIAGVYLNKASWKALQLLRDNAMRLMKYRELELSGVPAFAFNRIRVNA